MKKVLWVVAVVLLVGCASVSQGKKFNIDKVDDIEKCKTIEAQLVTMFGEPQQKGRMSEFKTLTWGYSSASTGFMGMGMKSEYQNLVVYLNKKGEVVEYVLNPQGQLVNVADPCK